MTIIRVEHDMLFYHFLVISYSCVCSFFSGSKCLISSRNLMFMSRDLLRVAGCTAHSYCEISTEIKRDELNTKKNRACIMSQRKLLWLTGSVKSALRFIVLLLFVKLWSFPPFLLGPQIACCYRADLRKQTNMILAAPREPKRPLHERYWWWTKSCTTWDG